ncbi:MAG: hypothetical protein MK132_04020 [Lentisphaerales bacterium]|nr:hypothetical protein [Lentisphaerales bacterium]
MKRILLLSFVLMLSVYSREKFIFDMSVMPHVLINYHKGYVAFHLKSRKVFKKLNDPAYLQAVNNGTLDRLLRSSEVSLDRKGFFPLPIKIVDFDSSESAKKAGIAHEYMDFARYFSKPHSDYVPVLNDLSYFVRAVKIDQLHARGWESNHAETINERTGYVSYIVKDDFTDLIPDHSHFRGWIKGSLGIDYAAEQDLYEMENLTEVDQLFEVFPDVERRKKSLRKEHSKILSKLLLAGYPVMMHSKKDAFILTGLFKESLYCHFQGQRYFGTLKSNGSHRLENNFTIFKLLRDDAGKLKTKLDDEFQQAEEVVAPVVAQDEPEDLGVTLVSLKEVLENPNKYEGKNLIFSCRITAIKLVTASKSLYLKFGDHFLQLKNISKGFYETMKLKTFMAKKNYQLHGDAAFRHNSPLLFKGKFKKVADHKLIDFENLESLSFRNKMYPLPER